jgi:hypothetical protein
MAQIRLVMINIYIYEQYGAVIFTFFLHFSAYTNLLMVTNGHKEHKNSNKKIWGVKPSYAPF